MNDSYAKCRNFQNDENRITEMILASWSLVESNFDPVGFQDWRRKAFECLMTMLGPDHIYTKYFQQFVRQRDSRDVLAGDGLLVAANEQLKYDCKVIETD